MSTVTMNGRPRKQLADQIDRLDSILDGMANGFNDAVADAAREAARLAVRELLVEVLANPAARDLFRTVLTPLSPPPEKTRWWERLKVPTARLRAWLGQIRRRLQLHVSRILARCAPIRNSLRKGILIAGASWQAVQLVSGHLRHSRQTLTLAGLVGVGTGTAGYLAGPVVTAVLLGGVVTVITLSVMMTLPWIRLLSGPRMNA